MSGQCTVCSDDIERDLSEFYNGKITVCRRCLTVMQANQRLGFC